MSAKIDALWGCLRRTRNGWRPVYLPQSSGEHEWWWRRDSHHELMEPGEAAVMEQIRDEPVGYLGPASES